MRTSLDARRLAAELLGTALLVFFAVGTATLSFGFKLAGSSTSAGVVTTALAFGLVLLALVYAIGPVTGSPSSSAASAVRSSSGSCSTTPTPTAGASTP